MSFASWKTPPKLLAEESSFSLDGILADVPTNKWVGKFDILGVSFNYNFVWQKMHLKLFIRLNASINLPTSSSPSEESNTLVGSP